MASHFAARAGWHHLARQEGFALNPCEVALALFGRHRAAYFVKVLHHGCLAFNPKLGGVGERLFDFRRHDVGGSEKFLNPGVLVVNTSAHFRAFWMVGVVQLNHLGELRIGQVVFLLKPGEFGTGAFLDRALNGGRVKVKASVRNEASENATEQNDPRPLHGSVAGHLVGVNRLDVTGAPFGGGLSRFAFAVPIARADTCEQKDGDIGNRQRGPTERVLEPYCYGVPETRGPGGFGARDPIPNRFLESGRQFGLRLPGSEKLAESFIFVEWAIVLHNNNSAACAAEV